MGLKGIGGGVEVLSGPDSEPTPVKLPTIEEQLFSSSEVSQPVSSSVTRYRKES